MIIKLLVDGGEMKPGPAVSQKLGPLGINLGKVIQEVSQATINFKGIKVPVELNINAKTRDFSVKVFSPPVAELIKKELKIEKGSGEPHRIKTGNLAIEQIIKIAKTKYPNMIVNNSKAAVKSVVGSCASLGILIENKEPKKVIEEIAAGKYDAEINQEKTELSNEKRKRLDEFFAEIKEKQDLILKKEAEEKAAEEEKKAEEKPEGKTEEKEEEK